MTRCEKSKRPVQRRPQKYRLWIQSVFSQAGLSQLDGVMVARAQGVPDDLRFRARRRVIEAAGGVAAVRGDPRSYRLPAIREGTLVKRDWHVWQEKAHRGRAGDCMDEDQGMSRCVRAIEAGPRLDEA